MKIDTLAIHAGQPPDPTTGAVMVPIYQVSTYAQDGVGGHKGYEYSRTDNPTRTPLQVCLAALEGAAHALVYASGLAATDNLVRTLVRPGEAVVCGDDVYGGTYRLFDKVLRHWGLNFSYAVANTTRLAAVSLSKTVSAELAPYGITVNTIATGPIATDTAHAFYSARATEAGLTFEAFMDNLFLHVPVGREGRVEEISSLAAYLCSVRAAFTTGENILCDGGLSITPL